jgi:putative PIN family toxin of toxin-antitoxin system
VASVTADTNIYISGLHFGGKPRRFLDLARAGVFRLDISEPIKSEILRVLREDFAYPEDALRDVRERIERITHPVTPTETLDIIKADPSDNRILECAAAAKSDYIVTGDKRHILPLGSHAGIPIVKVADFLRQLQGETEPQR